MQLLIIILLLFSSFLCSENIPLTLASFKGEPSTIIDGKVNVITGLMIANETDLVTAGSCPIVVNRIRYNDIQWSINDHERLYSDSGPDYAHFVHEATPYNTYFDIVFREASLPLNPKVFAEGVTNASDGTISGKTNLHNLRLNTAYNRTEMNICDGSKTTKYFTQPKVNEAYILTSEKKPNGNYHTYESRGLKKTAINAYNRAGEYLNTLRFNESLHTRSYTVTANDNFGLSCVYSFGRNDNGGIYLKTVTSTLTPTIEYDYYLGKRNKSPILLSEKKLPNGRTTRFEYYEEGENSLKNLIDVKIVCNDRFTDRVKAIYEPLGMDGTLLPKYQFVFHKGYTTVYDAHNNPKNYIYLKQRLGEIQDCLSGAVYRKFKFSWSDEPGQEGNLKFKVFTDAWDNQLSLKAFEYDKNGNVTKETLTGSLSSHGLWESFSTTALYTEDGFNLVRHEDDGRKETFYNYWPGTNLLITKVTAIKGVGIQGREFFDYGSHGLPIRHIVDDGILWDKDDLHGVTCRYITYIKYTENGIKGLPEVIEEKYLDSDGTEKLIKKRVNGYDIWGNINKETVYGGDEQELYTLFFDYDPHGNLVKKIDELGHVSAYCYDENDNLLIEHVYDREYHTVNTYDFSNRLIRKEDRYDSGEVYVYRFSYDLLGRLILSIDPYGQETNYIYDHLGRLIEKIYPASIDAEEEMHRYRELNSYDVADNILSKTDRNGFVTSMRYNIRGQVTEIVYPDGTKETSTYTLDGLVASTITKESVKTIFEYDYLKRPIRKITSSTEGEILESTTLRYNHLHLLEEIDSLGRSTTYQYDRAGRLISKKSAKEKKEFVYDNASRVCQTKEYFSETDYYVLAKEYDVLNRVIEERTETSDGKVLTRKGFQYDACGNQSEIIQYNQDEESIIKTYFDGYKRPLKIVDPLGIVTNVHYNKDYYNEWGQNVLLITTTDALGNKTLEQKDTLNRKHFEIRKNSLGKIIQKREFIYDGQGNLLKHIDHVYVGDEVDRKVEVVYEYDSCNRLISLIEGFKTLEQKRVSYTYNSFGQKHKIIKPDGVEVLHEYDGKGRLKRQYSSDGTIDYSYTYDVDSNVLKVEDNVNKSTTTKLYDDASRLIEEKQGNDLTVKFTYDLAGRLTSLTLPDESTIAYEYDSFFLKTIRKNELVHQYNKYNLSGQPILASLMGEVGELTTDYDLAFRVKSINAKHYQEKDFVYDAVGNLIEKSGVKYTYDDLYQLTSETGKSNHRYKHDSLYNLTVKDDKLHIVNALNQTVKAADQDIAYDVNGNLIQKDGAHFSYDALDRLIKVEKEGIVTTYRYDEQNRRLYKNDTKYLYHGLNEIGSVENDKIQEHRILGLGRGAEIGAAVLVTLQGKNYIPIHDSQGSVTTLVTSSGELAESFSYSAYGESEKLHSLNPWRFSSKRYDSESDLYYFGRRYYSPQLCKWITSDPAGFAAGPNLYAYVNNRPTLLFDLYGLIAQAEQRTMTPDIWRAAKNRSDNTKQEFKPLFKGFFKFERMFGSGYEKSGYSFRLRDNEDVDIRNYSLFLGWSNGMNNSKQDHEKSADIIAEISDLPLVCQRNVSHTVVGDLAECSLGKGGIATDPARVILESWLKVFENNPNARILQICHSQGAINVYNALMRLDDDLRQKIEVLAIAPAKFIPEKLCAKVDHYIVGAHRDLVPSLDPIGRITCRNTIHVLECHKDAKWIDHSFDSPTYENAIKFTIKEFEKKYNNAGKL